MMKRLFALFLVLVAVSCGPARHVVNVEMRYPSKSGLELAGKTISILRVIIAMENHCLRAWLMVLRLR